MTRAASAGAVEDCNSDEPARVLTGCTAMIEGRMLQGSNLAVAYGRRSDAFLRSGALDAAIADAERAADLDGNSASSKRRLSNALRLRGAIASDDNNKLSYFDRAITLDATNHAAFYARAAVHTERKDFNAAIRDLEKAIGLEGGEEL